MGQLFLSLYELSRGYGTLNYEKHHGPGRAEIHPKVTKRILCRIKICLVELCSQYGGEERVAETDAIVQS